MMVEIHFSLVGPSGLEGSDTRVLGNSSITYPMAKMKICASKLAKFSHLAIG